MSVALSVQSTIPGLRTRAMHGVVACWLPETVHSPSCPRHLTVTLESAPYVTLKRVHRRMPSMRRPISAVSTDLPTAEASSGKSSLRYKRVMLKVSGEALEGSLSFGIDPGVLKTIAQEVAAAVREGVEVAIVVGGGNFFRGVDRWEDLDRATGDYVGMLATVMNAICLQSALEAEGVATRVQTAISMQEIAEPYIRRRAIRHLERGRVVIFGAGTGNPFFTTDTAAALRAAEIGADAFFKATKVDGVYDSDPECNPDAKLHRHLSFREVLLRSLNVMDETAITLCKDNKIPVVVFNLTKPGHILSALLGDSDIGTHIACSCESFHDLDSDEGNPNVIS